MYHGAVQKPAESVLKFIQKADLLSPGDRVGLAVSGGADSVALLRLMLELRHDLGIVLAVIHFNHNLRGAYSDEDENFVRQLSGQHNLEFFCSSGDAAAYAEQNHLGIESAARSLRYGFFLTVMTRGRLNRIATAHTLDDQAETLLLKLSRGAGTRGLAGIYPKLVVAQGSSNSSVETEKFIVRPLLGIRRRDVEAYLRGLRQNWREDSSNRDLRHSRNVIRHGILPRLERNLNPNVREALAETAEIARAEEEYWEAKTHEVLPKVLKQPRLRAADELLDTRALGAQPKALQRRLIRGIAESLNFKLEFKQVEQVLQLASSSRHGQSVVLPGGWEADRTAAGVRLHRSSDEMLFDYEYRLPVPGKVEVPEAGRLIEAVVVRPGIESSYNLDHAFDPALLAEDLMVRNWRAGDRFWPAHSKSPKKIKELLQQRHIAGMDRKRVPVVVSGTKVIWIAGFAVSAAFRPRDLKCEVVVIREKELSGAE